VWCGQSNFSTYEYCRVTSRAVISVIKLLAILTSTAHVCTKILITLWYAYIRWAKVTNLESLLTRGSVYFTQLTEHYSRLFQAVPIGTFEAHPLLLALLADFTFVTNVLLKYRFVLG